MGAFYVYTLVTAIMTIFMQVGFTMIECGTVRRKNASSIFVKSIYNILIGIIVFWLFGYGLGFGKVENLIGSDNGNYATNMFDSKDLNYYPFFLLYFSKAITSSLAA